MIHFISNLDQISLLRDNLAVMRSMVETALPELAQNGDLKFRRGSSIVTYDRQRIMIQRQTGPKLAERIQVSFTFRSQDNPFLDQAMNQETALSCVLWFSALLDASSSSPRIGDPYAQLPSELQDIHAICVLAASRLDRTANCQVHLVFPTPNIRNPPPVAVIETDGRNFQLMPTILTKLTASIPEAIFVDISEFNDVRSSITLEASSLHFSVSADYPISLVDQMKAFAKYGLEESDLGLIPYDPK